MQAHCFIGLYIEEYLDEEEAAKKYYEYIIKTMSITTPDDFYYQGWCFFRLDLYTGAIENFLKALSIKPNMPYCYRILSLVYYDRK